MVARKQSNVTGPERKGQDTNHVTQDHGRITHQVHFINLLSVSYYGEIDTTVNNPDPLDHTISLNNTKSPNKEKSKLVILFNMIQCLAYN